MVLADGARPSPAAGPTSLPGAAACTCRCAAIAHRITAAWRPAASPLRRRVEKQTADKGARDLLTWTFPLAELGGVNPNAVSMLETVRWSTWPPAACLSLD